MDAGFGMVGDDGMDMVDACLDGFLEQLIHGFIFDDGLDEVDGYFWGRLLLSGLDDDLGVSGVGVGDA